MINVVVRDQSADASNRVVNVLRKSLAQLRSDFVVAPAIKIIGSSETAKIRDRFEVPYDYVGHLLHVGFRRAI